MMVGGEGSQSMMERQKWRFAGNTKASFLMTLDESMYFAMVVEGSTILRGGSNRKQNGRNFLAFLY
jgi:hypothetical protein